jgi:hypothetical protein
MMSRQRDCRPAAHSESPGSKSTINRCSSNSQGFANSSTNSCTNSAANDS